MEKCPQCRRQAVELHDSQAAGSRVCERCHSIAAARAHGPSQARERKRPAPESAARKPAISRRDLMRVVAGFEAKLGPATVGAWFWRFPCPICSGGFNDPIWRPLVVASDGRIWCDASLYKGYESDGTCSFKPETNVKVLMQALSWIRADD